MEGLDYVDICTPNYLHSIIAVDALNQGLHVFTEKPDAVSVAEVTRMKEAADKSGKVLMAMRNNRHRNTAKFLKNYIADGNMGDIYCGRCGWIRRRGIPGKGGWFTTKAQSGGGPLIDLGVHRLDLALWLMGYPEPAYVMGSTYAKFGPERAKAKGLEYTVEDLACAMIKFKNGATLELDASWASHVKEREDQYTRLIGTKAGLLHKNVNEGYTYEVEFFKTEDGVDLDSKLHEPAPAMPSAFTLFADAVRDDTDFLVKPEEGVIVMRLLDAIYKSAATGKPVEL